MKLLAVLFLASFALAYAVPVPSYEEVSLEDVEELDYLLSNLPFDAEERSIKDSVSQGLRDILDKVLERIKESIERGRDANIRFVNELKEIRGRFTGDSVDEFDNKLKEFLDKLADRGKKVFENIMDRVGVNRESRDIEYAEGDDVEEIREKVKKHLEEILEKIRDSIEKGNAMKEDVLKKLKEIRERMKELKVDMGNKAKKLIKNIKEKAKDYWQKLIDKLTGKEERDLEEVKEDLREAYERILERIKVAVEKGKEVREKTLDKLREIREKLREELSELNEKARDFLGRIKEGAKESYRRVLERLGIERRVKDVALADEDDKSDLIRRLRENIQEVAQKIKDALENGKGHQEALEKLREIKQKLEDLSVEMGEKGRELVKKLKELLLEKLRERREVNIKDMLKRLRDRIKNAMDYNKIKGLIESVFGQSDFTEKLLQKLKDKGGDFKERILAFIDRLIGEKETDKRSVKEVYEKVKNYFRDLKIELKEKFSKFGEYAKEKYEKVFESGKDRVENLKKLAREFINDARVISKDVAEQAKEFFREYREDLGVIYDDVKEKVRDILNKD